MKRLLTYKSAWWLCLSLLMAGHAVLGQTQQFHPVEPTGLPYHVIIQEFEITPSVNAPVEIGLFADTLCVGRTEIYGDAGNIDIVAWEGNPGYDLEGFSVGDSIRVRIATEIFDTLQIMAGFVTPVAGNGTYGDGSYAVIHVTANLLEYPAIFMASEYENLSFGNVYIGEQATDTIWVRNTGSALLSAWFNGIPSGFAVEPQGFNVPAGDSAAIAVTFAPYWVRDYNEILYLSSNDPTGSVVQVHLRGTGARSPTAHLVVEFDPQALRRIPSDRPGAAPLVLTNTGDDSLTIYSLETTHWIYTVPDTQIILPPGGRYGTMVVAQAETPGNYSGALRIYHSVTNEGNPVSYWMNTTVYARHFIPVEPTGLPYNIVINLAQVDGHLLPSPSDIGVFAGDLCVGEVFSDGASVNLQLVAWEADPEQGLPGFTAGDSIEFRIYTSAYDSIITIVPDVTWHEGDGTFGSGAFSAVELNGRSHLEPVANVSPITLMFGLVPIQAGDTLSFTIENGGATPLYIWNWYNSNPAFTPLATPSAVPAGGLVEIPVWFHPPAAAWETSTLTFTTNDPTAPYWTIQFSGGGTVDGAATLRVDTPELRFGDVPVGDTAVVALYLRNVGNAELVVTDIQFDSPRVWVETDTLTISPGSARSLEVYWQPVTTGYFQSQVFIQSNSSDDADASLNMNGFGFVEYFVPVAPTGQSYQIIVSSLVDSANLGFREGDEIGVFHENGCVGRAVYHPGNVTLTAWQRDAQHGLPGFVAGDLMLFKYHSTTPDSGYATLALDAIPTILQGDGTFGSGPFAEVSLTILDESNPLVPYDGPVYWVSRERGTDYLNNGQFSQPFRTIQHALNLTASGDTIWVEPGTYLEKLVFKGQDVVLASVAGADTTIITKPGDGPLVTLNQSETQATVIRGFTISGGQINGNGAGVFIENAHPTLQNLVIENNQSLMDDGGGIFLANSQAVIDSCVIQNNDAAGNGGGLAITNASTVTMRHAIVRGNQTSGQGAIFVGPDAGANFEHVLLVENESGAAGGFYNTGIVNWSLSTIANNTGSTGAGGFSEGTVTLNSTMLYGNLGGENEFGFAEGVNPVIAYSLVNLPEPGATNLNTDPLFVDLAGGDYRLMSDSPAIDAGDPVVDFQSEPEPNGDRVNLGYYGGAAHATISELRTPVPAQLTAVEDSLFSYEILFAPDSNVVFQIGLIDGPGWLAFSEVTQHLSGTPANDDVGQAPVTLHSWDNYGRQDTVTIPMIVVNTNDPPVIQSLPDTALVQDTAWSYTLEVHDPDVGDSIRYVVSAMPAGMVFDTLAATFSWTPQNGDVGAHPFTLSVEDDSGAVALQSFTLAVENVNDAPELVGVFEPVTIPEDDPAFSYLLGDYFRDIDAEVVFDSLSYAVSGFDTVLVQVELRIDTLWIYPLPNAYGATELVIEAIDLAGASAEASLSLVIEPVNDVPEPFHLLSPDSVIYEEYSDSLSFRWNASFDPDPTDTLLYQLLIHDTPDFTDVAPLAITRDTTAWIASDDLVQDVNYYWRVVVTDPEQSSAISIETYTFLLNFANSPPAEPVVIEPEDGLILTVNPRLAWHTVSDPDIGDTIYFDALVSLSHAFTDTISGYFGQDTTWNLADTVGLIENGEHFWRVRAVDVGGLASDWTGPFSFFFDSENEAPTVPTPIFPVEQIVQEHRPVFTWQTGTDADPSDPNETLRYHLRVWNDPDTLDYLTTAGDTSFAVPDSLYEDHYYHWQVATIDNADLMSDWSPPVLLGVNVTNAPPGVFHLLSPVAGDTVRVEPITMVWEAAAEPEPFDSVTYQLELAFTSGFNNPQSFSTGDTSLTDPLTWVENRVHYWRVRAVDTFGAERLTPIDSFYVDLIPNRPPVAQWLAPDSVVTGIVPLAFTTSDPDSQPVSVTVSYKSAEMTTFLPATPDPEATTGDFFSWNASADLPDYYGAVWLEIIPFDGEVTGQGDTTRVLLDNIPPAMNPLPLTGSFYDSVTITYDLDNDGFSPMTVTVDYRFTADDEWHAIATDHFTEPPGTDVGATQSLTWLSHNDLPATLGDSVNLRLIVSDFSAADTALSTPFVVINNYAPTVAFGELFQWNHDVIPIPVHYGDADDQQLDIQLAFSTNGTTFHPATLVSAPAPTAVRSQSNALRLERAGVREIPSYSQSIKRLTKAHASEPLMGQTEGDTVLYWNSRADLPDQYMWFAWLAVQVSDPRGASASDTANTLVDNFRPELSVTLPAGELTQTIPITGEIRNDSLHTVTLAGEYLMDGEAGWQPATLDYDIQPGDTAFSAQWHSSDDLPFGFDGLIDLRFFAFDSVQSSDTTAFHQVHVDNNQSPVITQIVLPEEPLRGDIEFTLLLNEPENDSLFFTFRYSTNNGTNFSTSTAFTIRQDALEPQRYYFTWHSFGNLLNYYDSDVRVGIAARDNDAGPELVSDAFLLNNRGGPRLARVINPNFPVFLWTDTLKLAFTTPLQPASIPGALALAGGTEPVPFTWWLSADSVKIYVLPDAMVQPLDTLALTIFAGITGANGLAFDGNYNYLPDGEADSLVLRFQTPLVADYSGNGVMEINDLTAFVANWNLSEPSLSYEIGPAVGEVPYSTFVPDGQFDFEDLMVFIAMWKWDHNSSRTLARSTVETPLPLMPLPETLRIKTSGIITPAGQPVATIALEAVGETTLPGILRWEISGLDSHTTAADPNWANRFENRVQINDGAGELLAGLTPVSESDQVHPGKLIFSQANIDAPCQIEVAITLWNATGELMARDVQQIDLDPRDFIPQTYFLRQNYPNPFNGNTRIRFGVPDDARVRVDVYNIKGEWVRTLVNGPLSAGQYVENWDGKNGLGQSVSTGIYFISLRTPGFTKTVKAVYLK